MTRRSLALLILINVVLLAGVLAATLTPREARAQFGAGQQFTMISGTATGLNQEDVVYLIDLSGGRILPLVYNTASDRLRVFRGRAIRDDANRPLRTR